MGFGIDETLYNNSQGRSNARAGLEYLVQDRAVKAATILTPHAYGAQVTGMRFIGISSLATHRSISEGVTLDRH